MLRGQVEWPQNDYQIFMQRFLKVESSTESNCSGPRVPNTSTGKIDTYDRSNVNWPTVHNIFIEMAKRSTESNMRGPTMPNTSTGARWLHIHRVI